MADLNVQYLASWTFIQVSAHKQKIILNFILISSDRTNVVSHGVMKSEDHWSRIAHLSAEDMPKSAVIVEKKLKNIEYQMSLGPK